MAESPAPPAPFIAADAFAGPRPGYFFGTSGDGRTGYHVDARVRHLETQHELAAAQVAEQEERAYLLRVAVTGAFTVHGPDAGDARIDDWTSLTGLGRYTIRFAPYVAPAPSSRAGQDRGDGDASGARRGVFHAIKFRGWDWAERRVGIAAATQLERIFSDGEGRMDPTAARVIRGGLHYFVGLPDDFWSMAVAFWVCGHVMPTDPAWCRRCCHSRDDKCRSSAKHRKQGLLGLWTGTQERLGGHLSRLLREARSDPATVCCMWHNTEAGCRAHRSLDGPQCRFAHVPVQIKVVRLKGPAAFALGEEDADGGVGRAAGSRIVVGHLPTDGSTPPPPPPPPGVDVASNESESGAESRAAATAATTTAVGAADHSRDCHYCGRTGVPLPVCTRCKVARYCSAECQRQDWHAGHKPACKAIVATTAAAAAARGAGATAAPGSRSTTHPVGDAGGGSVGAGAGAAAAAATDSDSDADKAFLASLVGKKEPYNVATRERLAGICIAKLQRAIASDLYPDATTGAVFGCPDMAPTAPRNPKDLLTSDLVYRLWHQYLQQDVVSAADISAALVHGEVKGRHIVRFDEWFQGVVRRHAEAKGGLHTNSVEMVRRGFGDIVWNKDMHSLMGGFRRPGVRAPTKTPVLEVTTSTPPAS